MPKPDLRSGIDDEDVDEEDFEGEDEGDGKDLKSDEDGKGIEAVEALSVELTFAVQSKLFWRWRSGETSAAGGKGTT